MESDVYVELNKRKYACSIKKLCTAVTVPSGLVCINCGETYHIDYTKRLPNVKYIKGNLISCCNRVVENDLSMQDVQNKYDELSKRA